VLETIAEIMCQLLIVNFNWALGNLSLIDCTPAEIRHNNRVLFSFTFPLFYSVWLESFWGHPLSDSPPWAIPVLPQGLPDRIGHFVWKLCMSLEKGKEHVTTVLFSCDVTVAFPLFTPPNSSLYEESFQVNLLFSILIQKRIQFFYVYYCNRRVSRTSMI
jgi:hypothetical protein